jgi:hypothetical protein
MLWSNRFRYVTTKVVPLPSVLSFQPTASSTLLTSLGTGRHRKGARRTLIEICTIPANWEHSVHLAESKTTKRAVRKTATLRHTFNISVDLRLLGRYDFPKKKQGERY